MRRKCTWVTTEFSAARVGKVLSCHKSRLAAERARAAAPDRRAVEAAQFVALVQEGLDSTDAMILLSGMPVEPAYVEVG